jgi:hypothetical protein
MHGLRDALEQSQKDGVAIGHFNVGDWVLLKAVFASRNLRFQWKSARPRANGSLLESGKLRLWSGVCARNPTAQFFLTRITPIP